MAAAKKSDNTDTVISSAAAALAKAITNIQEAFKSVDGLNETAETLTRDIAAKKAEISGLTEEYQTKYRQSEIDFNLKLAEKKDATINEYLKSIGKEAVESTQYRHLQNELARAITERNDEVKKAVAIENNRLTKEHTAELALFESQHQTATVKQTAQIEALGKENANLKEQVAMLVQQLNAERSAGIERSKASTIGSVNFPAPNGR